jgi:hypothetical protein
MRTHAPTSQTATRVRPLVRLADWSHVRDDMGSAFQLVAADPQSKSVTLGGAALRRTGRRAR